MGLFIHIELSQKLFYHHNFPFLLLLFVVFKFDFNFIMWLLFLKTGMYGVESPVYTNVVDGKVNQAFEAKSPPQYNRVKVEVQVRFRLFTTRIRVLHN